MPAWRWKASGVEVVELAADVARYAGPFDALEARELVDALAALRRVLGISWCSSVGRTAERLILETHPRARGGIVLDRGVTLPAPVLTKQASEIPYVAWRRELTVDERRRGWLHVFDANAQYLGAWITAELGHGQAVHVDAPAFDSRVAGVWRVPDLGMVPLGSMPAELPRPELAGREWFTTPTLARIWELAHPSDLPEIVEAWQWPRRSRFLRGAGERIRDARAAAEPEVKRSRKAVWRVVDEPEAVAAVGRHVQASTVLTAVKALYRMQTGRFAMTGDRDGDPWFRPDWAYTVRATARVNLHRRLCKLSTAPFAIATDALAFLTDEPDPSRFAARVGLPIGGRLGEFHHAGSARVASFAELGVDLADARTGAIMRAVGDAAELEGVYG